LNYLKRDRPWYNRDIMVSRFLLLGPSIPFLLPSSIFSHFSGPPARPPLLSFPRPTSLRLAGRVRKSRNKSRIKTQFGTRAETSTVDVTTPCRLNETSSRECSADLMRRHDDRMMSVKTYAKGKGPNATRPRSVRSTRFDREREREREREKAVVNGTSARLSDRLD
jgi:hypothetical protein